MPPQRPAELTNLHKIVGGALCGPEGGRPGCVGNKLLPLVWHLCWAGPFRPRPQTALNLLYSKFGRQGWLGLPTRFLPLARQTFHPMPLVPGETIVAPDTNPIPLRPGGTSVVPDALPMPLSGETIVIEGPQTIDGQADPGTQVGSGKPLMEPSRPVLAGIAVTSPEETCVPTRPRMSIC